MKPNGGIRGTALGWPLAVFLALLATLTPAVAGAQDGDEDWRVNLSCPAEHQVRKGLLYCTAKDEKGAIMHVIVADLQDSDLRFEYILPTGRSQSYSGEQQCRDVNVPGYSGPAGGCYSSSERIYPTLLLDDDKQRDAIDRAREVRVSPPVAAIINGDYGATNASHGPEGLVIAQGEPRVDGAANCDDDYNAVLRPWLGLGETVDKTTGLIPATIDRLASDSTPVPAWIFTGIGGGPWLVRDGSVVPGAAECKGEGSLAAPDSIDPRSCSGYKKATPKGPLSEYYDYNPAVETVGTCRLGPHTAVGLSSAKRWLFLAMSTSSAHPDVLARFMLNQLHASNVMKFDGGGSSAMWFNGATPIHEDADPENRKLTNWLGLYAAAGQGIRLPHKSAASERVLRLVRVEGEPAIFKLKFTNTGLYTWMPDDNIGILGPGAISFVGDPAKRHVAFKISEPVQPGQPVEYTWKEAATGLAFARFQMAQDGEPFGQDVQVIVLTVPQSMKGQAEKLQRELDRIVAEAQAKGEEGLNNLVAEVQKWFVKQGQDLLNQLAAEAEKQTKGLLDSLCGATVLPSLSLLGFVLWRRRLRP